MFQFSKIQVDYCQIGYATAFRVPMPTYRISELQPATKVIIEGDGVDDQYGVVNGWYGNQVEISLVPSEAQGRMRWIANNLSGFDHLPSVYLTEDNELDIRWATESKVLNVTCGEQVEMYVYCRVTEGMLLDVTFGYDAAAQRIKDAYDAVFGGVYG